MSTDETTESAFAWSLTLIAKIMVSLQRWGIHGDLPVNFPSENPEIFVGDILIVGYVYHLVI